MTTYFHAARNRAQRLVWTHPYLEETCIGRVWGVLAGVLQVFAVGAVLLSYVGFVFGAFRILDALKW